MEREAACKALLEKAGLGDAERHPIPGDASFRRYERVIARDGRRFILMDAPPPKEDVRPFLRIQELLVRAGYSAPECYASDEAAGFLLLEDLGDRIFARVLKGEPQQEWLFYEAAVRLLAEMEAHDWARDAAPPYDDALMEREVRLFQEWFAPAARIEADWEAFWGIWARLLPLAHAVPQTLVLRDYHAENLLWLDGRVAAQRVGLLDFQDAVMGPVTYDLVSLLEDARRDVSADVVERCKALFEGLMPEVDAAALWTSYAVMGAQRNLKIVGIFTRLAVRDGKFHYLKLLPRVWGHLALDLAHPALAELSGWMDRFVPLSLRGELHLERAA